MQITLEQMIIVEIHLGQIARYCHPKIATYTYSVKNGSHIIDVVKTRQKLAAAKEFVTRARMEEKDILFVGTQQHVIKEVEAIAHNSQSFSITERWLGGILTNWSTVQASILQLHRLERNQRENLWNYLPKR